MDCAEGFVAADWWAGLVGIDVSVVRRGWHTGCCYELIVVAHHGLSRYIVSYKSLGYLSNQAYMVDQRIGDHFEEGKEPYCLATTSRSSGYVIGCRYEVRMVARTLGREG